MKYYAQFMQVNHNRKLMETCGSDGVFILDGRNTPSTMVVDIMIRMHQLKKIKTFDGYRIYKGSRFGQGVMVKEWIRSGCIYDNKDTVNPE